MPIASFSDDPISSSVDDRLDREKYVDFVCEVFGQIRENGHASTVVGMIGPWGSGKSSVAGMVVDSIRAEWHVVTFAPWGYTDVDAMLHGFLAELRDALPKSARWKNRRKTIGRAGRALSPIGKLGTLVGVDGTAIVERVAEYIEGDTSPTKALEAAADVMRKLPSPVLVTVDDLDRLSPNELLMVFKLVRFVGRLPNVHYLLCYDEQTLLDLLCQTELAAGSTDRAQDYLEKMVQIRLDVPPVRFEDAERMFRENLTSVLQRHSVVLEGDAQDRLDKAYASTLRTRLMTPRAILRFTRQLDAFLGSLDRVIDPCDFVLITWVRTFEPRVYSLIQRDRTALTGHVVATVHFGEADPSIKVNWRAKLLELDRGEDFVESMGVLLGLLFLRFQRSWDDENAYSESTYNQLAAESRIGHEEYFDRYFAFSIPEDDISDEDFVTALTTGVDSSSKSLALKRLSRMITVRPSRVTNKISRALAVDAIDPGEALGFLMDHVKGPIAVDSGEGISTHPVWLIREALVGASAKTIARTVERVQHEPAAVLSLTLAAMHAQSEAESDYRPWPAMADTLDALVVAIKVQLGRAESDADSAEWPVFLAHLRRFDPDWSRRWLRERVRTFGVAAVFSQLLPTQREGQTNWILPLPANSVDAFVGLAWLRQHSDLPPVSFPPLAPGTESDKWVDRQEVRRVVAEASVVRALGPSAETQDG